MADAGIKNLVDFNYQAGRAQGKTYTPAQQFYNFAYIFLASSFLFIVLILNFLGLSTALNCNANAPFGSKIFAALFGFFFGFIYLLLNYYTYRVITLRKVCRFDQKRLFPFNL